MPTPTRRAPVRRLSVLGALLLLLLAPRASAGTLWGLTTANTLVRFDSADPGHPDLVLPITGLADGERLLAITIWDKDGTFFGLGSTGRLYTVDRATGAMTPFAAQTGPIITPNGNAFGMALTERRSIGNYAFEVISDSGQRFDMPLRDNVAGALRSPLPASAHVVAMGWLGGAVVLDSRTDRLGAISEPDGSGEVPTLFDLGPLGFDASDEAGMALDPYNRGLQIYATFTVDGVPRLYQFAHVDHKLTPMGLIGSAPITSLAADLAAVQIVVPQPRLRLTGAIELLEGTSVTLLLRRTGEFAKPVDYVVTGANADLAISESRVHFAAGEREKTITATVIDDEIREGTESLGVGLTEDRPANPYKTFLGIETIDNDNTPPVLTVTSPPTPAFYALADTFTVSGTLTDDRPGTVVYLSGDFEAPTFGIRNGSQWTFENVGFIFGGPPIFLNLFALDAEGGTTRTRLQVDRGTVQTLSLAEGATGSFFRTELLFLNPASIDVPVTIDFMRQDGTTISHALTVPAYRRVTLDVASVPGMEATSFATVVHAVGRIALERTMRWDAGGYGASTERASPYFSSTWHFAEGSQGFFSTFLLLVNPQLTTNEATVRFLRESGGPITRTYMLAPRARLTIDAAAIPELANQSFGIDVTYAQPGMAERSMYFGQTPLWTGGHASAGAPSLSTDWLLAEGATGDFFKTFVLAANPSDQAADVTFTFFPSTGPAVTRTKRIPANGRLTVNIEAEDPALANAAVGTRVISSTPIVVERSQYWPYAPDQWYEAHNSVAQTVATTEWTLAEGRCGGPEGYLTYILLTNPTNSDTLATVTFYRDDGGERTGQNVVVAARSRVTISVDPAQFPGLAGTRFGTYIKSTLPIVVERSMYWSANGQFWAAGTNAPGTPRPY